MVVPARRSKASTAFKLARLSPNFLHRRVGRYWRRSPNCRYAEFAQARLASQSPVRYVIRGRPSGVIPQNRSRRFCRSRPPKITQRLAERVRFELTKVVKPCRFSRPVHSTALPPLRYLQNQLVALGCARLLSPFSGPHAFILFSALRPAPRGGPSTIGFTLTTSVLTTETDRRTATSSHADRAV
jgi:hypothetical protein